MIRTGPAEGLAVGDFDAGGVDAAVGQDIAVFGLEVLAYDSDDRDVGEVACGDGEVSDGSAELVGSSTCGRLDVVVRHGSDDKEVHVELPVKFVGATPRYR